MDKAFPVIHFISVVIHTPKIQVILVIDKEERLVAPIVKFGNPYRPTKGSAIFILLEWSLLAGIRQRSYLALRPGADHVQFVADCIEGIVLKVVEETAMKVVGA